MSIVETCKNSLYEFSEKYDFEGAEQYIEVLDNWANADYYEWIDTLLYSLELSKLNSKIALMVIGKTNQWKHKLGMRSGFIQMCKDNYRDKDVFSGVQ